MPDTASLPVRRSVVVETSMAEAFATFTDDIDSWWPRSHHIGKAPMGRIVVEGRYDGRCYTQHEDGTECDFGRVLEWDPPHCLRFAWLMTHAFGQESEIRNASEVLVRFQSDGDSRTRVDVEHRFFERHQGGPEPMRMNVAGPNGWTFVLWHFTNRAARRFGAETERS
jgi:uncharacterized protein YndB with AHSA1/START domain